MSSTELTLLCKQRQYVRQRVTKLCGTITASVSDIDLNQRTAYIDRLSSLKLELNSANNKILTTCLTDISLDCDVDDLNKDVDDYDDKIALCLAALNNVGVVTAASVPPVVPNIHENNSHKLKLPQVPIPEFGNKKGENLQKFLKTFESITSKHNLSDYEKFIYLRKQLYSSPKVLIDSLDVDQHSYNTAKDLLEKAFDSKLNAKYDLIKTLSLLKLPPNGDPYLFIGEMRSIISDSKSLNITVDEFLQYFIWHGLNDSFQNHLTSITNKSKPSLAEINDKMFEATERYLKQVTVKPVKRKSKEVFNSEKFSSTSMAVNISKPKIYCVLCSHDGGESNHPMRLCPKYETAKNKFDKLKFINACTKCSFKNHDTRSCKFKFKSNCQHCNGAHMTFLCLRADSNSDNFHNKPKNNSDTSSVKPSTNSTVSTVSSISTTEFSQSSFDDNIVLPTFTAYVVSGGRRLAVRVFKDGGCQRTFVREHVAESYGLAVKKTDISVLIHGFNESKALKFNLVELCLEVGSEKHVLEAFTVPVIRASFSVGNVGRVVAAFKEKGYQLADTFYSETSTGIVNNLDIVLGADYDSVLPMQLITFGNSQPLSSFIETPIGVVLAGNVERMLKNLNTLIPKDVSLPDSGSVVGFSSTAKLPFILPSRAVSASSSAPLRGRELGVGLPELNGVGDVLVGEDSADSVELDRILSDTLNIEETVPEEPNETNKFKINPVCFR